MSGRLPRVNADEIIRILKKIRKNPEKEKINWSFLA